MLLTATFKVSPLVPHVGLTNLQERLSDYRRGLAWWVDNTAFDVVFCENSGHPYPVNFPRGPRIEVIQWSCDDEAVLVRGKGFGEAEIFRRAYALSAALARHALHVKCSGRYTPKDLDFFHRLVERRALFSGRRRDAAWVDSVCFAYQPRFLKQYLEPKFDWIDDRKGVYLEHCLALAVENALGAGETCLDVGVCALGRSGTHTQRT